MLYHLLNKETTFNTIKNLIPGRHSVIQQEMVLVSKISAIFIKISLKIAFAEWGRTITAILKETPKLAHHICLLLYLITSISNDGKGPLFSLGIHYHICLIAGNDLKRATISSFLGLLQGKAPLTLRLL